jgi:arylsulfatase A-like enzyme
MALAKRAFFHGFGTLWEGEIHVPCLIRWPGHIPAGTVSEQVAISMDLSATILAAAGISTPPEEQLDGIDLLPILTRKVDPVSRTLYWRLNHSGREQKAVRQGKWKYIIDEWNELLFDLDADPSERRDMSYRQPDVRQSLRTALDKWEKKVELVGRKGREQ